MFARRVASALRTVRPRLLRADAAAVAKPASEELTALEAKAKGPWNQLTVDEKLKCTYPADHKRRKKEWAVFGRWL